MKAKEIVITIALAMVCAIAVSFAFKACEQYEKQKTTLHGTVAQADSDSIQHVMEHYVFTSIPEILDFKDNLSRQDVVDSVFLAMSMSDITDVSEYLLKDKACITETDIVNEYLKRKIRLSMQETEKDINAHQAGPTPQETLPNKPEQEAPKPGDTVEMNNTKYVAL